MQEVRLRQARRHRETLRAVQGKAATILERPQESRRRSRWSVAGGYCWREDEEEIKDHFADVGKMVLRQPICFDFPLIRGAHNQETTTMFSIFHLIVFCVLQ